MSGSDLDLADIAAEDFSPDTANVVPTPVDDEFEEDVPAVTSLFDTEKTYFFGTWRRTPYDVEAFPRCLCGSGDVACLDGFDAAAGVIWRVIPSRLLPNALHLVCVDNADAPSYLAADLSMASDLASAGLFRCEPTKPFRGMPGDVPVILRENSTGLVLCSSESAGTLHLLTAEEADNTTGPGGVYAFNCAWEASMADADPIERDAFLARYVN
jgi:hypothetical protein|eukprot:gnl/Ergobibamus_cyprinoides/103.p2 GENE.gnl/Ergobibamus_cyprinoides/103~~gnl/Ergobibamus_cyprinoides/103.p2  ORF type:complete len:224 (+),score=67.69 gnl/Ergobibamus_cyprinoides/103:35-673(+)